MKIQALTFCLLTSVISVRGDTQTPQANPLPTNSVSGTVIDSLAAAPLAGAIVQISSFEGNQPFSRTGTTDGRGRFTIDSVPHGRYVLGFFHPMLDSLGIEPPLRELVVTARSEPLVTLAIPPVASFQKTICSDRASNPEDGALVVGFLRNAADLAPIGNATVMADWLEYSISSKEGMRSRVPRMTVRTQANGWFALCNVPSSGSLNVVATFGGDSTDRLELEMQSGKFLRKDLYMATGETTPVARTARLSGVVLAADSSGPIVGAEVLLSGKPRIRTNERGEWTISDATAGTRTLEVRAVGYYPVRRNVNVLDGAPVEAVQLATLKSVLATIRVTASRTLMSNMKDFEFRKRTGAGQFLTAADIERRHPIVTSDIFRFISGISILADTESGEPRIQFRRGVGPDPCYPEMYVDGKSFGVLSPTLLDNIVSPKEIRAMEIYVGTNMPPQFTSGTFGNTCGSIVIWTRMN